MTSAKSKRRMTENEAVFRNSNERMVNDFIELKNIADETGQTNIIEGIDSPILFYCECADESCSQRIKLKPSRYADLHKKRDYFVILPNHEVPSIEKVILHEVTYLVVQKYQQPTEAATRLSATDVHNV
jgi:hypothetical protein